MHKFKYILGFSIFSLFISNCSQKEYPLGKYQNTKVIADGDASDWGLPLRFGNENGSLQYAVTNDKENIYVSVASSDQATQMKMLRAGIKIYIDPKGNKSKDISLTYPFKDQMDMPRERNQNGGMDRNAMKQKMIMDADIFSTTGFINMENRIYDLKDTSHIKVAMNFDTYNNLVFETIIPIKNILNTPFNNRKAPSISVGIVINSFGAQRQGGSSEMRGNEREGMGGGMRGGMGGSGMRGGMSGGGMRGGMGSNIANTNISNWYQFKLAYQAD